MAEDEELTAMKAESEAKILAAGGQVCTWLPILDRTETWSERAICDRALAMHAMLQLAYRAPKPVVRSWLQTNELVPALSEREREIVSDDGELTGQTRINLYWYVEAIWAFAWLGSLVPSLEITEPVGDHLASLLPDLRVSESADGFRAKFAIRPRKELFRMLDLYYRAHWYARDGRLDGRDTHPFDLDSIMERRKALDWASDRTIPDWDETPADT